MDNLIGKVLGNRYEILERIGGGGMAVVYKAKCRLLNRFVAVKVLRTDSEMTEDFIKRFKIEAQAAGSLSHPNIVSIYDVGNEDGINYIVMEYVEGYTLKEVITQSERLTWRASVKIAAQICSGLEHAHKNHIIHRDIKSQNILVNSDLVAKVTDFGIARASSNSTITMTGNTIGSVHYFSPEQAKGQHTDEKSDIYSLGIVMYEMLTGRVPFDADTPVSVALKQIQELPIPPAQVDKNIPNSVSDIVLKALQKEPRLRYQSASEMLKDLENVLENPENVVVKDNSMSATMVMNSVTENMINERVTKPVPVEVEHNMGRRKKKSKDGAIGIAAFLFSLVLVLVIAFFGAQYVFSSLFGPEKAEVEMPQIVGMTLQEAQAELKEKNILIKTTYEQASDTVAKGKVINQIPVAGMKVKENTSIVEIVVSKGRDQLDVPTLINRSLDDAKSILDSNDLRYAVTEESSEEVPIGYVIRHTPSAGFAVEVGSVIELYVSSGPEIKKSVVPNLVGKKLADAKKLIEDNGLKLTNTKFSSDASKADGVVLEQSLDAGTSVDAGTEIVLTANKITTPSVATQTIYINLSNKGISGVPFTVRVDISGGSVSKKTVYEKQHTIEDGEIGVPVSGNGSAMISVYIDNILDSEQMVKFN